MQPRFGDLTAHPRNGDRSVAAAPAPDSTSSRDRLSELASDAADQLAQVSALAQQLTTAAAQLQERLTGARIDAEQLRQQLLAVPADAGTGPARGSAEVGALCRKDAAAFIGVSERTFWDMTRLGLIPCIQIGHLVRYDKRDLLALLDALKAGAVQYAGRPHSEEAKRRRREQRQRRRPPPKG
jgi:hypothetical protein